MSDLTEIGEAANWRCWLCDSAVDPEASTNSDLGPSVDNYAAAKAKKGSTVIGRLAHRKCNTMKGKIAPVVPWSQDLLIVDPSPIFETVERLARKGGREVIARCPSLSDAELASEWLLDRLGRLSPGASFSTQLNPGGGQYMLVLRAGA